MLQIRTDLLHPERNVTCMRHTVSVHRREQATHGTRTGSGHDLFHGTCADETAAISCYMLCTAASLMSASPVLLSRALYSSAVCCARPPCRPNSTGLAVRN